MAVVSACREMLGSVPQRAQPLSLVAIIELGTLRRLPVLNRRKVGMTSSPSGPKVQGYTRATMAGTKGSKVEGWRKGQKAGLNTEWCLRLDYMKMGNVEIAEKHDGVNTFTGIVQTARHTSGVYST